MFYGEAPVLEEYGVTPSLLLLPDPLGSGVVVAVRVPPINQIDPFKNYLYSIQPCAKKNPLKKQPHKKCKYECTMNTLTQLLGIKSP